jgi:hypothetical protein
MSNTIYESPDGGKTVRSRKFGEPPAWVPADLSEKMKKQHLWSSILDVSETDNELKNLIEKVEVYYHLKHG